MQTARSCCRFLSSDMSCARYRPTLRLPLYCVLADRSCADRGAIAAPLFAVLRDRRRHRMQFGGRFGDRDATRSVITAFAADAIVYVALLFGLRSPAMALALIFSWGFAFYSIAAPLQLRLVDSARDAPNLASTMIQSAFNFGIAAGPVAAAAALSLGVGYALLPICGLLFTMAGLSCAIINVHRRSRRNDKHGRRGCNQAWRRSRRLGV
jgi:MFS family permease